MHRILLVEDHPRLAQLVQRALERAGIPSDSVSSVDHARLALRGQPYAAMVIDRGLPDGDGLHLVRQLREQDNAIPCLMLTARDALNDRIEGLNAGADDYLSKPFSMDELTARVRALLRRPPLQQSFSPTFSDLNLDPAKAQLRCGDRQCLLPHTEVQIMLCLMRGAGQPVNRQALENATWGIDNPVTPNALDVALHRLRKKLDLLQSKVRIVNQRGVGYAVEEA